MPCTNRRLGTKYFEANFRTACGQPYEIVRFRPGREVSSVDYGVLRGIALRPGIHAPPMEADCLRPTIQLESFVAEYR